jgi:phage shock protein A
MLQRGRRGVADCDTSAKRVEQQITALAESSGELVRRAGEARAAGQPDLAEESLARKNAVEAQLGELREQYQSLREQADRLAAAPSGCRRRSTRSDCGKRRAASGAATRA